MLRGETRGVDFNRCAFPRYGVRQEGVEKSRQLTRRTLGFIVKNPYLWGKKQKKTNSLKEGGAGKTGKKKKKRQGGGPVSVAVGRRSRELDNEREKKPGQKVRGRGNGGCGSGKWTRRGEALTRRLEDN